MRGLIAVILLVLSLFLGQPVDAQTPTPEAASAAEATASALRQKSDLTEPTEEQISELRLLLERQDPGDKLTNPLKHAIRGAVNGGVPVNTIVLLLLLPVIATLIAGARHLIGIRGFGIFLPAALSVVLVATGPIIGIGLFLLIIFITAAVRNFIRKTKIRLQYLPRLALILWSVSAAVLLVLFVSPYLAREELINVSIFPILILVLLTESFSRVQIGRSAREAIGMATETLVLGLVSFAILSSPTIQAFALLNPELTLAATAGADYLLGKYVGLRFVELWRFRKLVTG